MRRVTSYGGASGIPASQRLKLKLSMTAGMHLLTNDGNQEQQGFLAPVVEVQHERIIHRTSGVTRNLTSIESFQGFVNRRWGSFTSVESATSENAVKGAKQGKGVESGLRVGVKTRGDEELVGSSAGTDFLVDGPRQKDNAGGDRAVSKHDHPGSSDVGNGPTVTTSSIDLTITPAVVNLADSGEGSVGTTEVSLSGSSQSNIINSDNNLRDRALGSDGTHAPESSVSCSSERLQERCQPETSCVCEVVDLKHIQDLKHEIKVCELASASTSSIVRGLGEDRRALLMDIDGGDMHEQDQEKDSDETIVVEESIPFGHSTPNVTQEDLLFERNNIVDGAALRIQNCWKGWLQRRQYRLVKEEVAATTRKNQELNNAAVVLQKSWRAAQSRLIIKHLKIEKTVRNRAVTVIQAHIRGHSCRRELKELSCAVLTIQKCWRRHRSSQQAVATAASWQQAEERRLHAAITLQAHVRGYVDRQKLVRMHRAAITIQRQWKVYKHRCTKAATKLQAYVRGFLVRRKHSMLKKTMAEEKAAVRIQACVRGHLVRCHLTILHTAALLIQLQWRRYSLKCQFPAEPLVAHGEVPKRKSPTHHHVDSLLQSGREFVMVENDVQVECFDEIDLLSEENLVGCSENTLVLCPDVFSLEKVVDITVDRQIDETEKAGVKGYDLATSARRDESGLRPLLNGELPAIPTGELPVGKASQNEDWNNVSVDRLDECLDTCLASLRPLPSDLSASGIAAERCFPKFVILEEASMSQQPSSSDRSTGYLSLDGTEPVEVAVLANSQASTISHSTPQLQRAPSRKGVKHELSRNVSRISSDSHLNQTTLSFGDSLQPAHGSSTKLNKDPQSKTVNHQVEEIDQGGGNVQCKSRHAESLKRNEERLQQFAQVFLLQRHIAYQQQRAQSAPPFPPPALAGSGSLQESQSDQSRDVCTKFGIPERDSDSVAVRKDNVSASQVTSRHTKYTLDRGNVYCSDTSSTSRQPPLSNQSGAASSFKQHRQPPGTDVVVDMVLLLRKIEESYGTGDVDFGEANNSCYPTRSGDIEEGGPVLDRRKRSSALGFTKSMSMTQIGLPNVNAMLLVIIAMVVYTKTLCQGVIFGTKQTHRKS